MVASSSDPSASTDRAVSSGQTAAPIRRLLSALGWTILVLHVLAGVAAAVLGGWLLIAMFTAEGPAPVGLGVAGGIVALFGVLLIVRAVRGTT